MEKVLTIQAVNVIAEFPPRVAKAMLKAIATHYQDGTRQTTGNALADAVLESYIYPEIQRKKSASDAGRKGGRPKKGTNTFEVTILDDGQLVTGKESKELPKPPKVTGFQRQQSEPESAVAVLNSLPESDKSVLRSWCRHLQSQGVTATAEVCLAAWRTIERIPPQDRKSAVEFSIARGYKGVYIEKKQDAPSSGYTIPKSMEDPSPRLSQEEREKGLEVARLWMEKKRLAKAGDPDAIAWIESKQK